MRGRLFVVCGGAGSGKSTLIKQAIEQYPERLELYKKYSERKYRGEGDDIRPVKKIEIGEFDLAYEAMGKKYGISTSEIEDTLDQGKDVIMPTTDFRAVERLNFFFRGSCVSLCVMSTVDTKKFTEIHNKRYGFKPTLCQQEEMSEFFSRIFSTTRLGRWDDVYEYSHAVNELINQSVPESKSLEIRKTKIRNFQTRLFEKPNIFDHIILNYRDGRPDDMLSQFSKIYNNHVSENSVSKAPILYVISSASGHGKGSLAEALRVIAPNEISIVEKQAKRAPKKKDKEDGLIPIGVDGIFGDNFNFRFFSHKTKDYAGTEYAFDLKNVKTQLRNGKSLILIANSISNIDLYKRLRKEFTKSMVHIYLWRFQTESQLKEYQVDNCDTEIEAIARMKQTDQIYKAYLTNITKVDFLLLNTSFPEDLHNQVFNLLTHHEIYN